MPQLEPVDYTPEFTDEQKERAITIKPRYTPVDHEPEFEDARPPVAAPAGANAPSILDRLFGLNGTERYQLWPEKLVRGAIEAPQKALRGELAPVPTEADPSGTAPEISAAQDMMNLVGVGAATPKPGGMIGMAGGKIVQPTAPTFYSAAEHAITNARQPQASADQWLGYLNNSPGVKAEELEWTGLSDLFAQRAAEGKPVTKQEILDHLGSNKVDVQTKIPTGGQDFHAYITYVEGLHDSLEGGSIKPRIEKADDGTWRIVADELTPNYEGRHTFAVFNSKKEAQDSLRMLNEDIRKGGSNPEASENLMNWADSAADHSEWATAGVPGKRYEYYQLPGGENYSEMVLMLPEKKAGDPEAVKKLNELSQKMGQLQGSVDPEFVRLKKEYDKVHAELKDKLFPDYLSPHWDEPNILAHVRFNDRTINGKKTLFLEEVQSDWHQAGRESGYKGSKDPKDYSAKHFPDYKGWQIYNKEGKEIGVVPDGDLYSGRSGRLVKNEKDAIDYFLNVGAVPDAPFKKTWPELVLKRMLRKAADEGYEQIAWTPGKVQNERYPGRGKDEEAGMAKFYDEILPNVANKLGKKFGAKTEKAKLDVPHDVDMDTGEMLGGYKTDMHVLPITPELKATATGKGFPLFSTGLPFMFTPVDHNPFEENNHGQR